MRAGRELDALVAEKVMGWKWFTGNKFRQFPEKRFLAEETDCIGKVKIGPDLIETGTQFATGNEEIDEAGVLPYSTNISAAWQVVEKMGQERNPFKSFLFNLSYAPFGNDPGKNETGQKYQADFFNDVGEKFHHRAKSDTAPHAICLAALKAAGVDLVEA